MSSRVLPGFFMIPSKKTSTAFMLFVFTATWVKPIWPLEHALHSSLTVIGFFLLWRHIRFNDMSDGHYLLIALFLSVHSIAARWLYTNVPYDYWMQSMFGFSLNQYMGWTRNNFDRLVHFLYGYCFTPAIVSHVVNRYKLNVSIGFYIAISAIMITSLWYEWFEWIVALTLSAREAEAYNGQQGDMWDAHKDMLMATIGSAVWAQAYLSLHFCKVKTGLQKE